MCTFNRAHLEFLKLKDLLGLLANTKVEIWKKKVLCVIETGLLLPRLAADEVSPDCIRRSIPGCKQKCFVQDQEMEYRASTPFSGEASAGRWVIPTEQITFLTLIDPVFILCCGLAVLPMWAPYDVRITFFWVHPVCSWFYLSPECISHNRGQKGYIGHLCTAAEVCALFYCGHQPSTISCVAQHHNFMKSV